MLVVTRKKDERLIIGNEIEIQVLRIGRDNVRLGIKAPSHISIYRYEIYEAIRNENLSAVKSQIPDKAMLTEIAANLRTETARGEANGSIVSGSSAASAGSSAASEGKSGDQATAPGYRSDPENG
jgi:carbon storage regulator